MEPEFSNNFSKETSVEGQRPKTLSKQKPLPKRRTASVSIMVSTDGKVISWSNAATTALGYSESEILGKSFSICYKKNGEFTKAQFTEDLKNARLVPVFTADRLLVTSYGIEFLTKLQFCGLYNAAKDILGYTITFNILLSGKSHSKSQIDKTLTPISNKPKADLAFSKLIETGNLAILLLDRQANLLYKSRYVYDLDIGNDSGNQKISFFKLIHPDDLKEVTSSIKFIIEHPASKKKNTFRISHASGQFIWVECIFTNLLSDRDIKAIVVSLKDVNQEKANGLLLEKSEKRFKAIIENSTDAIVIRDKNQVLTYVSPGYERILGYSIHEAINFPPHHLSHPDDWDYIKLKTEECLNNPGITVEIPRFRARHKNGNYIWLYGFLTNLLSDPAINGFVRNFRLIDKEVEATEKLEASERRFKALVENGMDGIVVRDKNQVLTYASPGYERLMGYTFEEAKKFPIHFLTHPDDSEYLISKVKECLENPGKTIEIKRYRALHKNGKYIWLTGVFKNLLDDPAVNGFVRNFRVIENEVVATEKLQASEKYFKALVENGMEGIVVRDKNQHIVYASPAYEKLMGYSIAETQSIELFSLVHPDDLAIAQLRIRECLDNPGVTIQIPKYRAKHKNGHYVWFSGSLTNLIDDPAISGIINNFREIEKEVSAMEQLAASEKRFKSLVENGSDGIVILNVEGKPVYFTQGFSRILGYLEEDRELIDDAFIVHPDDLEYTRYIISECLKNPVKLFENMNYRAKHKNGNFVWLTGSLSNFINEPSINGIVHNFRDVTNERQSNELLQRSEKYFKALVENGADGIVVLDANRKPIYTSPAYHRVLGYTIEEAIGLDTYKIIHPDDLGYIKSKMFECLLNPAVPIQNVHYRKRHKNGNWIYLNATFTNFLMDPAIKGIVNNFRDITEEKELQEYQLKLFKELHERNTFIETIIENIPIGISVNHLNDQKLTMVNKQFYTAYGWNVGDFDDVESFFKKVYPDEEYRNEIAGRILADIDSGDITRMNWPGIVVTAKNGEKRIINAKNFPLYSQNLMISTAVDVTEESKKTEEIKRIKANQDALINGTNDFIWSVNRDLCIITQNNIYSEFVKLLNGKPIKEGESALFEGLGVAGKKRWKELYERGLAGENFTSKTSNFDEQKGIMRYALISVNPMRDVNNEIFGVSCYVKDITDDTLNTIELEQTKAGLEKILDSSQDLICTLDKQGIVLKISKSCELLLGYKPEEIIGTYIYKLAHPDDLNVTLETSREVLNGKTITNFENRYIKKDGSIVYLSWSAQWDPIEQVRYAFGRDITEKKKWESLLIQSEAKYKNLFENNPLPILIWDFETLKIVDCNLAAINKYGYTKEEFLKLDTKQLRPVEDLPLYEEAIKTEKAYGNPHHKVWRHKKKNGELMYMEITGHLINYNGRKVSLALSNDVTESRYYHELEKLEKNILEMNTRNDRSLSNLIGVYLTGIESLHPGMLCSIFEKKGEFLYNLAAPGLDPEYVEATNGLPVKDNSGSCGTAVFLKKNIIVHDIQNDDRWENYKKIAEYYGLKACWSNLIWDANQHILGTFACYYKESRKPSNNEIKTIERAVNILQIIFESYKREKALQLSNERFEYAADATTDIIWDWDLETNGVYYSGNMTKLFGHKAGIDNNNLPFYFEHVHPDDRERVILYPDQVKYGNFTSWSQEYRFKKADGEYAYVLDKALVIRDDNGLGIRMVGAMHDVTRRKREEQRLKLLESVVTHSTDSVMITEANTSGEPSPLVLYVNEAFTKTTGYKSEEIIGNSPRLLSGPKTDQEGLKKLNEALKNWTPIELTAINYKKNGEEFWNNFSVIPVTNELGVHSHWISIERDVTKRKNEELQKELLQRISRVFNENENLKDCLNKTLELILEFGNFGIVEFWLVDSYRNEITLEAQHYRKAQFQIFANSNVIYHMRKKGDGLPGRTWQTGEVEYWNYKQSNSHMRRYNEAVASGIKRAYSIPLIFNDNVIGTLALILDIDEMPNLGLSILFEHFSKSLGAEIKRKQLEEELNQIFLFTPDILCMASTDGYFTKVNPSMSAILEYSEDELLRKPLLEFVHPQDRERTLNELQNKSNGSPSFYIENRYVTKTGKVKWIAWTTTGASEKGIIFCSGKDVTEKKEVEELLYNATTLARIGAWEIDLINNSIQWSDITREIHETESGFNPDRETAVNFFQEGADRKHIVKTITEAVQTGKTADVELRIVTAKGNLKWVRVIVEAEFINGVCRRVFGSFQDINERKQAEILATEALIERNTILESIGDAFFAVNKNWEITYWNKVAAKIVGKSRSKVINRNLWEVFDDNLAAVASAKYLEAVETNQAVHFEIYDRKLEKWFEISAYPAASGLSIYFKDITDRKLADKQFIELNENLKNHAKDLAKSNAELEQFAYVASHDLQEPLRMVTSFLTILQDKYNDKIDDKGKQYIYFAVDGAKRMRQIILDLLEFSRVGRMERDFDQVDISTLVNEIMVLFKRKIEDEKAEILFDKLPTINTFRSPIRQVLQNLIGNAIKYHKPGVNPVVSVRSEEMENFWLFEIKDNGIGIKPEYFEKIFIIFQRLHAKDEYSGTGMGLAIAKKIIENLGGKIWLESEFGTGTSFFFTIPKEGVEK